MQAVADTIAALGQPVLLRSVGSAAVPTTAIGRWRHGPAVVDVPPSDTIRLAMTLADGQRARAGGAALLADRVHAGSISVFAPSRGGRVAVSGDADVLQLFMPREQMEALGGAPLASAALSGVRDGRLQAAVLRLLVAGARGGMDDALLVDESLVEIAHRLACAAEGSSSTRKPSRGGLAVAAWRRVDALLAAALDEAGPATLADLAQAAHLSVTHLVRAFREHTGSTPHQYLVRRRLERGLTRLREAWPVAAIADDAGFATPAHFVASFRAATGVTPGAVSRALRAAAPLPPSAESWSAR